MWGWFKRRSKKHKMHVLTEGDNDETIKLSTVIDKQLAKNLNTHVKDLENLLHRLLWFFNTNRGKTMTFDDMRLYIGQAREIIELREQLLDMQVWSSTRIGR